MSVKFRDYYDVLGVPRDAAQDQIRKAFRKLARKYHPDTATDKTVAEEKFKELNEAYEVLSDPEKRRKYDALGPNWQHGSDFTPPPGAGGYGGFDYGSGGYDFGFGGTTGFSDFFESLFGRRASAGDPFQQAYGEARTRTRRRARGRDIESDLLVGLDEVMKGATRQLRLHRPSPNPGKPAEEITIRVHIPKGIKEGQQIRCAGMGEPGTMGGEAGDLLLRARIERHPNFQVRGADLTHELLLAPWECVLGATVKLDTLHGAVNLKIPAGTQAGTEFRLRGKGLPKDGENFGDLYAIVKVAVPKTVSETEARLWEKLAEESGFSPRS